MPSLIAKHWLEQAKKHIGLMLDYDGTLAPIVANPSKAFIDTEALALLQNLCQHPKFYVAIVSGRSVEQLKEFLRPLTQYNVLFCGLHGGEIYHPLTQSYLFSQKADINKQALKHFKTQLNQSLNATPLKQEHLIIEDKSYSIALHYRNITAEEEKAQIIALFQHEFEQFCTHHPHFKLQQGKEVIEILPKSFSKGHVVDFLQQHWHHDSGTYLCYAGDDLTDESAFSATNHHKGLSICIGKSLDQTNAAFTLTSPQALIQELYALYTAIPAGDAF